MLIVIRLIGILEIVLGVISLLSVDNLRKVIAFFSEGKKPYLAGILKILAGAALLFTATRARIVWIILALGVLWLAGGIFILTRDANKAKALMTMAKGKPVAVLRLYAVAAVLIGTLIMYSA